TAGGIGGLHHVIGRVREERVQAMPTDFHMWRNAIEGLFDQYSVGGERLYQLSAGVVSHDRDLIHEFQPIDGFTRRPVHLVTVRIKTAAAIDEQHHRERQTVLAKVRDLLFGSVFVKQEIFQVQTTDNAGGLFLHHQRINLNQVGVDLDDVLR